MLTKTRLDSNWSCWMDAATDSVNFLPVHCGKKYRKIPQQITHSADLNIPVTENFRIKFPTSISEFLIMYLGTVGHTYSKSKVQIVDNWTFKSGYSVIYNYNLDTEN
jgi:hypothetical protein